MFFRTFALTSLGLATLVAANAGQINIGTGANGINGLTGIATGTPSITSATSTVNPGLAVATTNVSPGRYVGTLFNGASGIATTSQNLVVGASQAPPNGNQVTGEVLGGANGQTFALINDSGLTATQYNVFAGANQFGTGTYTSTFYVPINVANVTSVDTMLNDQFGVGGISDTTVTFNFTDSKNSPVTLTFNLVNGLEIRSSTLCTGVGTQGGSSAFNDLGGGTSGSCQAYTTALDSTKRYDVTGSTVAGSGVASVGASNVWTGTYTTNTTTFANVSKGSVDANTSGKLFLDAQDFTFGNLTGDYLNSILITSTSTNADPSRLALSAVSLVSTPEPGSMLLMVAGLGSLVALRKRFV